MTVREYLERYGYTKGSEKFKSLTFILAMEVKSESFNGYVTHYRTTPIRSIEEWISEASRQTKPAFIDRAVMIRDSHMPIEQTNGGWQNHFKSGHLLCFMVEEKEDVYKHYSKEQADRMIEYWEEEITAGKYR